MPWWCDKHKQHSIDEICPGCATEAQAQEWKYHVVHSVRRPLSENRLKVIGCQGWELAAVVQDTGHPQSPRFIYYFKMPRRLGVS